MALQLFSYHKTSLNTLPGESRRQSRKGYNRKDMLLYSLPIHTNIELPDQILPASAHSFFPKNAPPTLPECIVSSYLGTFLGLRSKVGTIPIVDQLLTDHNQD